MDDSSQRPEGGPEQQPQQHSAKRKVRAELERSGTRLKLVRTARRVLADDEAEDAAHDAVLQALMSAGRFREDAQVGTWLYRIAFNAALMKQRSEKRSGRRLRRLHEQASPAALPDREGPTPTAAQALEERELRLQLRAAVARLPEGYRTVIDRCVYQERSAPAVAAELGISASALRTRFGRARERLRTLLKA
jgi:RNA polymerase sigma-70 factor, ECF subfamily